MSGVGRPAVRVHDLFTRALHHVAERRRAAAACRPDEEAVPQSQPVH